MEKFSEWMWYKIYLDEWCIIKKPKKRWNINEISRLIDYSKERFFSVMIDTEIETEKFNNNYIIRQPYIEWEHINIYNIWLIENEFEKLLKLHSDSIDENWIWFDFVWLEWSIKWVLSVFSKYFQYTIFDKLIISPILKVLSNRDDLYWDMLTFWEQNIPPELSNFIIDQNNKIKYVDTDLIDLYNTNMSTVIHGKVIEWWNKKYIFYFFNITL